jgi:transcriptional regulator with XRE-family HTH domain
MMSKDTSAFLKLLEQAERKFPTQKELAEHIGIEESRYSNIKSGKAGVFNVKNCLKLALLIHRPPGEVLRAANHADIAELLDTLYSHKAHAAITIDDEDMAGLWKKLSSEDRDLIRLHARRFTRSGEPKGTADERVPRRLARAELRKR